MTMPITDPKWLTATKVTEQWLDTKTAADHIRVKPRTLLSLVKRGLIPAHQLSGSQRVTWRFLASELDRALLERSTGATND